MASDPLGGSVAGSISADLSRANELRDLCTLLFTYFESSLRGDFAWVATYRKDGAKAG